MRTWEDEHVKNGELIISKVGGNHAQTAKVNTVCGSSAQ